MTNMRVIISAMVIISTFSCNRSNTNESPKADILTQIQTIREQLDLPNEFSPAGHHAFISGKIKNTTHKQVTLKYHPHPLTWGTETHTIALDEQGTFNIALQIPNPRPIVYLSAGTQNLRLFLEPNDSLHILLNEDQPEENHLSGRGAQNNRYLVDMDAEFPEWAKFNYKGLEREAFSEKVEQRLQTRFQSLIQGRSKYNLTPSFVRYLLDDMNYEWASLKIKYPRNYFFKNGVQLPNYNPHDITDPYFNFINKVDFANDWAIRSLHYMHFLARNFSLEFMAKEAKTGHQGMPFFIGRYDMAKQKLAGRTRHFFLAKQLASGMDSGSDKDLRLAKSKLNEFTQSNPYPEYTTTLNQRLQNVAPLAIGEHIPSFTLPNLNGKEVSLDHLNGNVILINFWASWCSPCIGNIPYLDEISKQTQGKSFKILNISLDENPDNWKKIVSRFNIPGLHVRTEGFESLLPKYFQVGSLPAYVLLNKNGQILDRMGGISNTASIIRKIKNAL